MSVAFASTTTHSLQARDLHVEAETGNLILFKDKTGKINQIRTKKKSNLTEKCAQKRKSSQGSGPLTGNPAPLG